MRTPIEPEAYESLLEQGLDLQRRHDELLGSRTWRMQLAISRGLRTPSALLRLPAELWGILRSTKAPSAMAEPAPLDLPLPPSPLPLGKPVALVLVPWLGVGGAERVVLEIIRGLAGELRFAVLPASAEGGFDREFRRAEAWIYPPPGEDYAGSASRIASDEAVERLLISSCPRAYEALPRLRKGPRVQVMDIVHNAAPEGALVLSVRYDRFIDCHFAVGEAQAEALRAAGVSPAKIVLARNGVDCHGRFRPDSASRPAAEGLLLGWVGRLAEEKDPALFVHAVAAIPEARGLLIGDGPERFHVESLIRRLGLEDRVRIAGFTSDVAGLLAGCDALLLTSRIEGSPLTILEAMSLEKPVIAADVGAVSEAVEDGVTGLLAAGRTPEAFAAAVRRLGRGPALGENARRRVVERFSLEGMLAAYRGKLVP